MRNRTGLAVTILVGAARIAQAQPTNQTTDVEVPALVLDTADVPGQASDESLDLANVVQSAAKGVTTVQEAPAIVTVVTADEIRDRQFTTIEELVDTVPGWSSGSIAYSVFPMSVVRGNAQAVQFLHDGLSLFDPMANVTSVNRAQPMELVKRVEMITGPGGVLWGSNSLLGILNIITKDAEDVDGVEVGATLGSGKGDRLMSRAYAMFGAPDLLGGKLKVFAHGSVETYKGAGLDMPLLLYHGALPQPNSANVYGPLVESDQARSLLVNLDAKITYDKLQLRVYAPISQRYNPLALSGGPSRESLPEDTRCPEASTDPTCTDPRRTSRDNEQNLIDRYAVLEYRTRFAKDKAGLTARVYGQQFIRGFSPLQVLAPSQALQLYGGLAFQADLSAYRTGAAVDGDIELPYKLRLLYGAEAFYEWKPDDVTDARNGPGTQSTIPAPYDLTHLPLLCPRIYDAAQSKLVPIANCPLIFGYPADRTVVGAYVDPQWRPTKGLILDAGARVQVAPSALGKLSYDPNITVAASAVWNFIPNWHLKLNFAQGFRPPVFNDLTANGEAVNVGGNPNLGVETSDATQAEVNARIYKGERRIRELSFRIDGSYTRLHDLIQINSGNYFNSGERGIASVEFLGRLFVQGGHRIELGYTYLRIETSDKGRLRSIPENAFQLAGVWSLVPGKLTATTTLKVSGATYDPDRLVEYRGLTFDVNGTPMNTTVNPTDLVMDRLPPMAELNLGVRFTPSPKLAFTATIYDAFAGHFYQPDVFYDYEPHLEYLPSPYAGFRAYVSGTYAY